MPCTCRELETEYSDSDCKCTQYHEHFPDCTCEKESVSEYSPKLVADSEILVRTLFSDQLVNREGNLKPLYFRQEPESRGFSVDRVDFVDPESLALSKREDRRFKGYLMFIAVSARVVRRLSEEGTRLFCVYDTATVENVAHADICQNLILDKRTPNRKKLMMEIAWRLKEAFSSIKKTPPTALP